MKKILLALAFIGCMFAAHAQEKPSTGDLYDGLTRPLTFNRVIPVSYTHLDVYKRQALTHIQHQFTGTRWFIEGDIKGFFDNINHNILIDTLRERISDCLLYTSRCV